VQISPKPKEKTSLTKRAGLTQTVKHYLKPKKETALSNADKIQSYYPNSPVNNKWNKIRDIPILP